MTKEQRAQSYEDFKSHYLTNHPLSAVVWDIFPVVEALWSLYSYCLGSLGQDGFWLFLEHLAYVSDPANKVSDNLLRTLSSYSEQGLSISYQISKQTETFKNQWLSLSPYGNKILLLLERCNSQASVGFTARRGGCC